MPATPMFSVVVPVHDVRDYLPACLDSILGQSFGDIEVIAVDDASPDDSGAILDRYAADDGRLRVVHLADNVGLGPARDVGIDAATGRYLLFVDSDDEVPPGSFEALAERIETAAEPDIVVFDFARTFPDGRVSREARTAQVRAGAGVFAVDEHPELLRVLVVVWNKAYRLDWVRASGLRFPTGYYEDVPWTYPALISARRIAMLHRVGYHYRQGRVGNILRSRNRRHFAIFDQYARTFAYIAEHPDLERWRAVLFERMTRHYVAILSAPDRVPPELRREFFDTAAADFRARRPDGHVPPSGAGRVWWLAFERGDYRMFRAAQLSRRGASAGRRQARRVPRAGRRAGHVARRGAQRGYYAMQLRRPVDPDLAVYAAYWARGYSCNPRAIYEEALRSAPRVRGVWVVRAGAQDAIPAGVPYVVQGSPGYYRVMARGRYFVNNVNFPTEIVKRPGTVYVQTQHGTPLKTMGMALRDYPVAAAGMDFETLRQRSSRWDYVLSSNEFSTDVWQRSFPDGYETLEYGYPRNDRLVNAGADEVAVARAALGVGGRVLLYAPTFRDWQPEGADLPLDLAAFCDEVGAGWTVLVRAHYLTSSDERIAALVDAGRLRDVSSHPVVEDLLLAADVLLTDYSSVMFDYADLDRPVVVFADDWDTYVRVRGVNLDLLAAPPGFVARSFGELVDGLRTGRHDDDAANAARAAFRARFCVFDDGHAAERVVSRVFLDGSGPAQDGGDRPSAPVS